VPGLEASRSGPVRGATYNRIMSGESRIDLTVRLSYDSGKTWPVSKLLNPGRSAYSNLAILPDGSIGCLYERGKSIPYETITFARFTMDWLVGGG